MSGVARPSKMAARACFAYTIDGEGPFTWDAIVRANVDSPLDAEVESSVLALEVGASFYLTLGAHGVFRFKRVQ